MDLSGATPTLLTLHPLSQTNHTQPGLSTKAHVEAPSGIKNLLELETLMHKCVNVFDVSMLNLYKRTVLAGSW